MENLLTYWHHKKEEESSSKQCFVLFLNKYSFCLYKISLLLSLSVDSSSISWTNKTDLPKWKSESFLSENGNTITGFAEIKIKCSKCLNSVDGANLSSECNNAKR